MRRSLKSKKEYSLPSDKTTKIITTIGILITTLPIAIFAYFELLSEPIILAIAVSILIVSFITYLYSPRKIILENDRIIIKRTLGSVEIPYSK